MRVSSLTLSLATVETNLLGSHPTRLWCLVDLQGHPRSRRGSGRGWQETSRREARSALEVLARTL